MKRAIEQPYHEYVAPEITAVNAEQLQRIADNVLDRLLGVAGIPPQHRWLDAATVAAMLCYRTTGFLQGLACLPSFPKASRSSPTAKPRWNLVEVDAWMRANRDNPEFRKRRAKQARARSTTST